MQADDEVRKCTDLLLSAIKQSPAYAEYEAAREELNRYPDKRERADQFRRDNFIARNYSGDETSAGRADLYSRRQQLRMDPVIDRYLCAELVLCRLLRESVMQILNTADLELDGMKDIL